MRATMTDLQPVPYPTNKTLANCHVRDEALFLRYVWMYLSSPFILVTQQAHPLSFGALF